MCYHRTARIVIIHGRDEMNIFDYINFYYVISVNIIIWATIQQYKIRTKRAKKLVSLCLGTIIALGFGYVDYMHSQGDFSDSIQKLFLSFTIAVFMYDYTIKLVMDFFKKGGKHESHN
jgi:hypothetical protein